MSNGAQPASGGVTYRMLRELGSRSQHSYAAIREPQELVVAQRFVRSRASDGPVAPTAEIATPLDGESMALLLRDARCLGRNWHQNIARVRHVDLAGPDRPELTVATEMLDGTTLADLFEAAQPDRLDPRDPLLPLPVLVRILLDVLAGLHALHGLRDGMNAPLGTFHGELCPANVVVGKDGVARIVNVLRRRPVRVDARSEAVAYAAPEALDVGGAGDLRADVYAVGVMLWEGIAGKRLYDERLPALVLTRQREGELAPPPLHPSSPFARLSDVAMRALAFDPALRFRGAGEMAAELRKVAGARLASGSAVAASVLDLAGERIRMRRAVLDPAISGTRRRVADRSAAVEARRPAAEHATPEAATIERAQHARSATVKASLRRVVPTLEAEVSIALIAASRPSSDEDRADVLDADHAPDDDAELPGPRGSSPELDLEAAIASANEAVGSPSALLAKTARMPAITPMTPNLPFPAAPQSAPVTPENIVDVTRHLMASALAATTAKMRAVALERSSAAAQLPATETPGDFVIPIDVTETLNEAAPAKKRRRTGALVAAAAACATVVLVAMGSFVATRSSAPSRATGLAAPTPTAPPPAMMESAPPSETTAIAATPRARASVTPAPTAPASVAPTASTAPKASTTATVPANANALVAPAPPAPAKPKKSIYDPDGL